MQPSIVLENPVSQNSVYKYYFSFCHQYAVFERGFGSIQFASMPKLNVQYGAINYAIDMSIVLYTHIYIVLGKVPQFPESLSTELVVQRVNLPCSVHAHPL